MASLPLNIKPAGKMTSCQLNNKLLQAIPFGKLNRKPGTKLSNSNNSLQSFNQQCKQTNFQVVMPH
jgi:hypothetical protein